MLNDLNKLEETYSTTKSNLYQLIFENYNEQKNNWEGKVFELPIGMTEKEMYIVLSYILDYINISDDMNVKTFIKLDIYLEKIGFFNSEDNQNTDINIIKINSNYNQNKWYVRNANIYQIRNFYDRINYIFDLPENNSNSVKKMLKK